MENKVLVESKIRQKLKLACTLLCIVCLCLIAMLVCVTMIGNKNLNGQVREVTGRLDEVFADGSNTLTIDTDKYYNVVWNNEKSRIDLSQYKGQTITLVVSNETFANSNPWALGLVVDGKTIVDYNATLNDKIESNNEIKTIVIVVTIIICVATCGVFIWRFNVKPLVERELCHEFAEFLRERQPSCKERKYMIIYACILCALLLALTIVAIVLDSVNDNPTEVALSAQIVACILCGIAVLGTAGLFILREWIARKEIDFYTNGMPFDFCDISHAHLRKKVKEELQKEIRKDRELHPHTYADGGNGYDVTFDEKGVTLTIPHEEETNVAPEAEEIFGLNSEQQSAIYPNGKLRFTYEELNLEAVAHFRKYDHPMMIIVKSRLNRTDDFPEELVNDIHIPFDLNFFNTMREYRFEVANLNELLNGSKQLMLENCLTARKNNGKMPK